MVVIENKPTLNLISDDWGETSNHLMIKAWGLNPNSNEKCINCAYYIGDTCSFLKDEKINDNLRACARYQSKKAIKSEVYNFYGKTGIGK